MYYTMMEFMDRMLAWSRGLRYKTEALKDNKRRRMAGPQDMCHCSKARRSGGMSQGGRRVVTWFARIANIGEDWLCLE